MKFSHVLALSVFSPVSAVQTQLNGWYPCSDYTFSDQGISEDLIKAECGIYNAPLCYPGICDSTSETTVDIFVKRILASNNSDTATNVWVLQGGPGYSSTAMESLMVDLYDQLEGTVNVYTMDHRGTGRSTFLDCVAAQAITTGSPRGHRIDPAEVPFCAEDLQFKYGDLASFSVTSAAMDLSVMISDYSNGANTTVYGVSYGTAWVERLIHLNPSTVTGYVLDSVAVSSGAPRDKFEYFSTWNIDFGEVGEAFLALCEEDVECKARFEPKGLAKTLGDLLETFDKEPNSTCAVLMNSVTTDLIDEPPAMILRSALGALLQRLTLRKLIAPLVYRLNRCSHDDVEVLTYFGAFYNDDAAYTSQDDAFYSPLLYYLIIFSEMWETLTPSSIEMRKRFTDAKMSDPEVYMNTPLYCAFSKENSTVCNQLNVSDYMANGIIYQQDKYWNKSAIIPEQASVLLLNGKLDPVTLNKYAEALLESLDGDNKELVSFEYSVHDTISSTPLEKNGDRSHTCGLNLLVSYVKNNGDLQLLDKACVDEQPEFNYSAPTKYVNSLLGTDDAYEGLFNSSLGAENSWQ